MRGSEDDRRVTVEKETSTAVPGAVLPQERHLPGHLVLASHGASHRPQLGLGVVVLSLQPPEGLPSLATVCHTRPPPPEESDTSRLHLDVAALVLDVSDDGDQEPDHLQPPAPVAALLLTGDAVLQRDGGHVARPQPGAAAAAQGEDGQDGQERQGGNQTEHLCGGDDLWAVGPILESEQVM